MVDLIVPAKVPDERRSLLRRAHGGARRGAQQPALTAQGQRRITAVRARTCSAVNGSLGKKRPPRRKRRGDLQSAQPRRPHSSTSTPAYRWVDLWPDGDTLQRSWRWAWWSGQRSRPCSAPSPTPSPARRAHHRRHPGQVGDRLLQLRTLTVRCRLQPRRRVRSEPATSELNDRSVVGLGKDVEARYIVANLAPTPDPPAAGSHCPRQQSTWIKSAHQCRTPLAPTPTQQFSPRPRRPEAGGRFFTTRESCTSVTLDHQRQPKKPAEALELGGL